MGSLFARGRRGGRSSSAVNRAVGAVMEGVERRLMLAAGQLDPTFGGGDGVAAVDFPGLGFDVPRAVLPLAGGGFLVAADNGTQWLVAKYDADGTRVNSFGGDEDGIARVDLVGAVAGIALDGTDIVLGGHILNDNGSTDLAAVRLDSGGATQGVMTIGNTGNETSAGVVVHGGRIFLAGSLETGEFYVASFNANGSFHDEGEIAVGSSGTARAVGIDPGANRLYVFGQADATLALAAFDVSVGVVVDTDFGIDGISLEPAATVATPGGMYVDPDFGIYLASTVGSESIGGDVLVTRVEADGKGWSHRPSLHLEGRPLTASGITVIDSGLTIYVSGTVRSQPLNADGFVAKIKGSGSTLLDIGFAGDGVRELPLDSPDDVTGAIGVLGGSLAVVGSKSGVAGDADGVVLRLDATTGAQVGTTATIVTEDSSLRDSAIASKVLEDGRVVAVGLSFNTSQNTYMSVTRTLPDGSPDPTFGAGGTVTFLGLPNYQVTSVEVEPDPEGPGEGRIILGAVGPNGGLLIALLANGSFDQTFGTGGILDLSSTFSSVGSVSLTTGGFLVGGVGGFSTSFDLKFARVSATGASVTGPAGSSGLSADTGRAVELTPGGTVVLVGTFAGNDSDSKTNLVVYNGTTFTGARTENVAPGAPDQVNAVVAIGGVVYVGGYGDTGMVLSSYAGSQWSQSYIGNAAGSVNAIVFDGTNLIVGGGVGSPGGVDGVVHRLQADNKTPGTTWDVPQNLVPTGNDVVVGLGIQTGTGRIVGTISNVPFGDFHFVGLSPQASNAAPNPSIVDAPATSPEGTTIALTSSVLDPDQPAGTAFGYAWSVTMNGQPFGQPGTAAALSFTPNNEGTYVVTLVVTDAQGAATTAQPKTITVLNADPVLNVTQPPSAGVVDQPLAFTATATDAGPTDVVAITWTITPPVGEAFTIVRGNLTFTPTLVGNYTVAATATDADGGNHTLAYTVQVASKPPIAAITGAPTLPVAEGTAVNLGSTVDDTDGETITYAWSVKKNGNPLASGASAGFSFTPNDEGTYVVTLVATDPFGLSDTETATVIVENVAPVLTAPAGPISAVAGEDVALSASATDAGTADVLTISWTVTGPGLAGSVTGNGPTFTFPTLEGTYTVQVVATDGDGGVSATHTLQVVAASTPPVVTLGQTPASLPEGSSVTLAGSATDSPGDVTTLIYSWTVTRNGLPYGSPAGGQSIAFAPVDDGAYVVTLTATDRFGESDSESATITVTNVAPVVTLGDPPTIGAIGQPRTFSATVSDAGTADTHMFAWTVRDESNAVVASGAGPAFTFTPTAAGSYSVRVVATDDDGAVSATVATTLVVTAITFNATNGDLVVGGGSFADDIRVRRTASGAIEVQFEGVVAGLFNGVEEITIRGGAGNDMIAVAKNLGVNVVVHGGDGSDELQAGSGGDVLLGEAGNDTLKGRDGVDILVGGDGDDHIQGGDARDVLIGGRGADRIIGQHADDILIAGRTAFDDDPVALRAIRAEWLSSGSYADRTKNLRGETTAGLNNGVFLVVSGPNATVFDDAAADLLTGNGDMDWFLVGGSGDKITDLKSYELFDETEVTPLS